MSVIENYSECELKSKLEVLRALQSFEARDGKFNR